MIEFITVLEELLKSIVVKFEQLVFVGETKSELLSPRKDIFVNLLNEEELERHHHLPTRKSSDIILIRAYRLLKYHKANYVLQRATVAIEVI